MKVQKVKARTRRKAVEEGLLTEDERRISEAVDLEAKEAAGEHLVPTGMKPHHDVNPSHVPWSL